MIQVLKELGSCGYMEAFFSAAGGPGKFGAQTGGKGGQGWVVWLFKTVISNCVKCPSEAKMFHSGRASPKSALEKIIALQQY